MEEVRRIERESTSEVEYLLMFRPDGERHIYRGARMSEENIKLRTRVFYQVVKPFRDLNSLPPKAINNLYVLQVNRGSWERIIVNYPNDCETYYGSYQSKEDIISEKGRSNGDGRR